MNKGWISLNRKIQDNWLWQDKPFSKGQAWIDILLMVNHKDNKVLFREELIEVNRGERITSQVKLAERWGWSRGKVRKFLSMLENDEMLHIKTDKRKTVLKVVNYNVYQDNINTKSQQTEQQESKRKPTDTQEKDINNNDNNVNNENNENIYRQFKHLSISVSENEKLINRGYTQYQIDNILNKIQNWSKNDKYTSLYLTAMNWLKREYGEKINSEEEVPIDMQDFIPEEVENERS